MKKIVPKNAEIERFIRGEQQNAKSKNKNPTQKCRKLSISFYLLQGGISRSSLFLYVCTGFRESWNLFSNIIFHSISPLVSLVSHLEPRNLVCCCLQTCLPACLQLCLRPPFPSPCPLRVSQLVSHCMSHCVGLVSQLVSHYNIHFVSNFVCHFVSMLNAESHKM